MDKHRNNFLPNLFLTPARGSNPAGPYPNHFPNPQ